MEKIKHFSFFCIFYYFLLRCADVFIFIICKNHPIYSDKIDKTSLIFSNFILIRFIFSFESIRSITAIDEEKLGFITEQTGKNGTFFPFYPFESPKSKKGYHYGQQKNQLSARF